MDRTDHSGPVAGSTVRQIVPIDRGDDCVLQSHDVDGFGDVARRCRVTDDGFFRVAADVADTLPDTGLLLITAYTERWHPLNDSMVVLKGEVTVFLNTTRP